MTLKINAFEKYLLFLLVIYSSLSVKNYFFKNKVF